MSSADEHQFKGELFAQFACNSRALSTGRRPELLELLAQAELSIEDLGTSTPICAGYFSAEIGRKIALPRLIVMHRRNPDRNSKTYHLQA